MRETRHHESAPVSIAPDAFAMEYSKVRNRLPEQVHKPLDIFRDEVLEICAAHGVDHPTKLGREGKHASTKTLEHVARLLENIAYIFEHKEIPPGYKDWEVEIPKGDKFMEVVEKDGRVFFSTNYGVHTGTRIFDSSGHCEDYPNGSIAHRDLEIVDGKSAYIINDPEVNFVFFDGEKIGSPEGYKIASHLLDMNGELVYIATNHGSDRTIIYKNGQPYGSTEGYYEISRLLPVGDELAFAAKKEINSPVHVYLGDHLVSENEDGYQEVIEMAVVNGTLAFLAREDLGYSLLVHNGIHQEVSMFEFCGLQEIDGQLSWIEQRDSGQRLFIGKELQGVYANIHKVLKTKAGIVIVAILEILGNWFLIQKNEIIGNTEGYERIPKPQVVSVGSEIIIASGKSPDMPWVIESASGTHFYSCEKCHLLKAVDDTHFIVIAEEDGKVVQRTFDIEHSPYQGEVNT
ncbi:TPA: hypothetical protein DEP34_00825 [Candidatus Uhrbacteria bacterium]|uniref:Uncharacterized protein n=2 Tax=Candidatus Uhriibacteriota TaxID=1752732 RepID=A0A0G1QAL7_9BACT|nr:MAG: hypothetical protein UX45_C0002G0067 [Candidatus Uhrbacteria bacterium GW2011_GWF2_46_218]KKU41842.1 MAG: hypothetical protein UX57_C0001G0066 [Candidatus Uhrbacteria bacterium GW2011_GWE2_46_68]HBK34109.1 hypothetical protein [Candidatus Uhrbacteria bacterium]HCB18914.1 hypothetical protein [Candidatus Uhrbacteria bacterium]